METLSLHKLLQAAGLMPPPEQAEALPPLREFEDLDLLEVDDEPLVVPMAVASLNERAGKVEEEAALLHRIKTGDEVALATLYQRWSTSLHSLAFRILSDVRDAEDAVQEGFVQLWRKAQTYNAERSSPFTWAYLIFRRKALDVLRARERQCRSEECVKAELPTVALEESPAVAHVRQETCTEVVQALGAIKSEQRQAIEMAFFNGLTHGEIAARLGVPLGTIKARIRRGLAQLQELLARVRFEKP